LAGQALEGKREAHHYDRGGRGDGSERAQETTSSPAQRSRSAGPWTNREGVRHRVLGEPAQQPGEAAELGQLFTTSRTARQVVFHCLAL